MANENYTALRTEGANLMCGGGKSFQSLAAELIEQKSAVIKSFFMICNLDGLFFCLCLQGIID